ncbi:polysaccharide deacetylase family protein [Kitasatospora indigofera]|uniref:polysaccharide deacetylase family protein n=1 Tax=Kitasatospora indigofera TaxID=67307 RepID=UPI0033B25393
MSRPLRRLAACAASAAFAALGLAVPTAQASAEPAPTVNLATNPGFEIPALPLADWGAIPGWNCGAGEAAVSTGQAHTGDSALSVTPATGDSTGECAQTVSVLPNTTYTVSAWVRGAYVFLGATGTGHDVAPSWVENTGGQWQRLTTTFTTGAGASTVRLYLHGWYGQGPFAADDVRVDGPAPAPAWATWNVPTTDNVVFFTIDDGWQRTPEAEQVIAAEKLPVTAFPLPMPSGFEPGFFKRVTAVPGSSVQNHSVSHRDLSTLPLAEQQAEICDARDAAARVYGTPTTVFRPPYLAFNADTLQAAANCGIRTVVTATADFSWGASNVWHGGPLQAGDVVLMHFTDTLAADLQRALAAARAAGLRPAGLTEYLH